MSVMKLFDLEVISQETVIYQESAESLTAPASEGEVTILAHHAPFFSKINPGKIIIRKGDKELDLVIGSGFIDVSPQNKVTLLVDSATRVEEIDIQAAEAAKERAEQLLNQRERLSRTEILRAEASLRKAVLELRLSRARRRPRQLFTQTEE